ncbi:MAG: lipid-A-disaccharide synthase [Deltaproteobacteria bacterium]|nr:lipid-A-disaccharide synthase [Deltaproteobacteria bacterium]
MKRILIVAGEASGDLHGANLVRSIQTKCREDITFEGIGGTRLASVGVRLVAQTHDLAVMGFQEIFPKAASLYKIFRRMIRRMDSEPRPDLLILIDFPDFNLALARVAKARGIKVFYYISPQVWAWRRGRVRTIARLVDHLAVILPFEPAFYSRAGVPATFVGHPLLDALGEPPEKSTVTSTLGLDPSRPLVALLPGSRRGEVSLILPAMLEAAAIMAKSQPELQFVLPVAPTLDSRSIQDMVQKMSSVQVLVTTMQSFQVTAVSDVALVASGTATLETALAGCPLVVTYRVTKLNYLIGRSVIKVDFISLVNLVAGRKVVEELIQEQATPDRLAAEALTLLHDPIKRGRMLAGLTEVKTALGQGGASNRAADLVLSLLTGN